MHSNMREMSVTELAAISGGGFWGDLLAAIGNAIDNIIDGIETIIETIRQAF
jgi:bacteriocin-like protein